MASIVVVNSLAGAKLCEFHIDPDCAATLADLKRHICRECEIPVLSQIIVVGARVLHNDDIPLGHLLLEAPWSASTRCVQRCPAGPVDCGRSRATYLINKGTLL